MAIETRAMGLEARLEPWIQRWRLADPRTEGDGFLGSQAL